MADHYEVLGISRQASSAEVRKAYGVIAREKHPDRFQDPAERRAAEAFFTEATSAFNALSSERSRREYDLSLSRPDPASAEQIAKDAYQRGLERHEARDYHAAIELFRVAIDRMPEVASFRAALGRALARNPNWTRDAVAAFEAALELEPRRAGWHAELALIFHGQGLKIRGRRALDQALALAPQDPAVREAAEALGPELQPSEEPQPGGLGGLLRRKP